MVDASLYMTFLVAAFVLVIIPGPDMMMILTLGVRYGPTAGFMAALGVSIGLGVHTAAAVLGLSALFTHVPALYNGMRWAGAAYLAYLAIKAFRDRGDLLQVKEVETDQVTTLETRTPHWRCFRQAAITNVLNPKVIFFCVAFFPQFINPARGDVGLQLLILGATLVAVDLLIDGPIGLAAGRLGRVLQRQRIARALNIGCGTLFAGLALRLIVTRD